MYIYDNFNRTSVVKTFDGQVQINRYDPEYLRHEVVENGKIVKFIYNKNREVITESTENKETTYIRTAELIASSNDHDKTYYHYASDEMGSITHIVDDDKILNEYEYDAWGNVTSSTEAIENRFKFNGQQLDPITEQYYLRARYYNTVIARFTQEDTYRGDGLNLYAYCGNNPVSYVDPTGFKCEKDAHNKNNKELKKYFKGYSKELREASYHKISRKQMKAIEKEMENNRYCIPSKGQKDKVNGKYDDKTFRTKSRKKYEEYTGKRWPKDKLDNDLQLHHIKPISLGGKNDAENFVPIMGKAHKFIHRKGGALDNIGRILRGEETICSKNLKKK